MTNELTDTDINDMVPYERDNNMMAKAKSRLMIFMKHKDIYKMP